MAGPEYNNCWYDVTTDKPFYKMVTDSTSKPAYPDCMPTNYDDKADWVISFTMGSGSTLCSEMVGIAFTMTWNGALWVSELLPLDNPVRRYQARAGYVTSGSLRCKWQVEVLRYDWSGFQWILASTCWNGYSQAIFGDTTIVSTNPALYIPTTIEIGFA